MLRLSWSDEALNYIADNEGLIDQLELAFADFRREGDGKPKVGVVDEIGINLYLWQIHGHLILLRHVHGDVRLKVRVEVIRPETIE